jgi:iron(III) transport system substrate-binding protein
MSRCPWTILKLLGLVLVALLVAACAEDVEQAAQDADDPEAPATDPAEEPADADAVSGELSFYTSQPDADYEALVQAFNDEYPDVEVSVFRSGTEEVVSRLLAEQAAGDVQADVLLVADEINFRNLKDEGLLATYESPELEGIPEEFVDEDFTFAGTKIIDTAIVFNTNEVEEPPSSWWDLADNAGDAVMPSPQYSGAAAYNVGVMTRDPELGWELFEDMAAGGMTVVQGNGGVLENVAEGRQSYGMVVSFIVARAAAEGSPVAIAYPEEGVLVITEPVGIVEGTENREAAEALVDFILGQQGQELAAELGYTPLREGVAAPEGLPTVDALDILEPDDVSELLEAREEDTRRFVELFGET